MRFGYYRPCPLLREYIKYFWIMESDPGEADVTERVVPTGYTQIMFHYKTPFVVLQPGQIKMEQPRSFISGINNTYADVSTHGSTGVIAVTFHHAGACNFFRFPMQDLGNRNIDLKDISNEIRRVEERVGNLHNTADKVAVIENFLLEQMHPIPRYDSLLIQNSIEMILKSSGKLSARELSGLLCVTAKTLERKFSVYLGQTPWQFMKIIRFVKAFNNIISKPDQSLTDHAYQNGYSDQSHFTRDFRTYSGYTPKEFRSRACNYDSVQIDG